MIHFLIQIVQVIRGCNNWIEAKKKVKKRIEIIDKDQDKEKEKEKDKPKTQMIKMLLREWMSLFKENLVIIKVKSKAKSMLLLPAARGWQPKEFLES